MIEDIGRAIFAGVAIFWLCTVIIVIMTPRQRDEPRDDNGDWSRYDGV